MRSVGRFAANWVAMSVAILLLAAQCKQIAARVLLAVVMVGLVQLSVVGQQYRSDEVDRKAKSLAIPVQRIVKGQADYNAEKANFDQFFQGYYFPAMTGSDPESLENLGELRLELFTKHLWATNNEQLQKDLTAMAFKAMGPVALGKSNPPYHPTVRYNAILTIGLLDDQYAIDAVANRRAPKPLPQANALLVKFLSVSDKFPPSLLVGALIGLERHAKYRESLPPDAVAKMTDELVKIAAPPAPIAGVNREVGRWIQIQAARTLAKLGSVGPENKAHDTLLKLIADEKLGVDNRLAVASLFANINYEGAKVDGQAAADGILALARALSTDETERARKFEDLKLGSSYGAAPSSYGERGGGGYGRGDYGRGYGGGGGGFVEEGVRFERRQVMARVLDLQAGLEAIKPISPADAQSKIDAILASIAEVMTSASNKDTVDLVVVEQVRSMLNTIDNNTTPASAEEAAVDDEFAAAVDDEPADTSAEEEAAPPAGEAVAPAEGAATQPVEAPPAEEDPAAGGEPAAAQPQ